MSDVLNYIDDYFTGMLDENEKRVFEQRCITDETFAKEVAEYISIRDGIAASLKKQKKEDLDNLYQELSTTAKPFKLMHLKQIVYWAAACILLVLGGVAFFHRPVPQKLAGNYISENLTTLGLNMGASDSLQAGISAYNSKSYPLAVQLFKPLVNKQETAPEAVKYLGLTYLAMRQYNDALKKL